LGLMARLVRNTTMKTPSKPFAIKVLVPWSILVAGLIFTVVMSLHSKLMVDQAALREFEFTCNEIRINILERLKGNAQILRSGVAFFNASDSVTREDWHDFTEALHLETNYPGIQGIGYSLLIPPDALIRHTKQIQVEGFPDYAVRPAGDRKVYTSIIYLEPFSGRNLRAFGYDMYSEPVRRAAMERARDENAPALSGKVILVQETGQDVQFGTLMYMPVYRHGEPVATIEQRRSAIQGWVYSPYRMADLMRGNLRDWDDKQAGTRLELLVYDGLTTDDSALLYDSFDREGDGTEINGMGAESPSVSREMSVEFAGHGWTLLFKQRGGLTAITKYRVVWINAVGGTIISILLFILVLSMIRIREGAAQLAVRLEENRNLLGELQHRAKNSFSMICSLINLSSQSGGSSLNQEAFAELESRVRSVSELYSLLYASGSVTEVRLDDYCRQVSETISGLASHIVIENALDPVTVSVKTAAPIGLIVNELLTNSIKYAFPGDCPGVIAMTLRSTGSTAILEVADDGAGLPPGFDLSTTTGMGLTLVQALSKQVGGRLRLEQAGPGTRFVLEFPLAVAANPVSA